MKSIAYSNIALLSNFFRQNVHHIHSINQMLTMCLVLLSSTLFMVTGCKSQINNASIGINSECDSLVTDSTSTIALLDTVLKQYKGDKNDDDIGWYFTLLEFPEFRELLNNPCRHKRCLLEELEFGHRTNSEKTVILYSMQRLCIDEYLNTIERVVELFLKNKISERQLNSVIKQDFWSLEVIKNYSNPSVRRLLTDISKRKEISEPTRKRIENILSGRAWENLDKHYRWGNESERPWTCN